MSDDNFLHTSIAQFMDLVQLAPRNQSILLVGDTGIGKTAICKQAADLLKLRFAAIRVNEGTDITDVVGLPDISGENTVYKPYEWYDPDTPTLLLMDEANRNKVILKGLMGLATDHTIATLKLAPGSMVIGAVNPEYGSIYQVAEMDPAQRRRFLVVELEPSTDEWLAKARNEWHLHPAILEYIGEHPTDLDTFKNESNVTAAKGRYYHNVLPCRSQWTGLSEWLYNAENFKGNRFDVTKHSDGELFLKWLVSGMLGNGVAKRFVPFYYSFTGMGGVTDGMLTPRKLLEGTEEDWDPKGEFVKQLKKMAKEDIPGLTSLGERMAGIVESEESTLWNGMPSAPNDKAKGYAMNVFKYLFLCPPEVVSSFYFSCVEPSINRGKKWPNLLTVACPAIHTQFKTKVLNQKTKED